MQAWAAAARSLIDSRAGCTSTPRPRSRSARCVYIYLFHNSSFYFVRNMFMVAMGIALVGYTRVPDRAAALLPRVGLRRHASRNFTGVGHDRRPSNALFNPYAAVPSMHVLLRADDRLSRWRALVKHRWRACFWAVYPLLMTFVDRRDRQPLHRSTPSSAR